MKTKSNCSHQTKAMDWELSSDAQYNLSNFKICYQKLKQTWPKRTNTLKLFWKIFFSFAQSYNQIFIQKIPIFSVLKNISSL